MIKVITVTGRRMVLRPMTGVEESMLLDAAKASMNATNKASNESLHSLIRKLTVSAEPALDFTSELTGEEFDILYLIRLISLGPIYSFGCVCPSCNNSYDYKIDIRRLRRKPQLDYLEPDNDPAVELREYDLNEVCVSNRLTADFEALPVERAGTNPSLTFTLPVSGKKVTCNLPVLRQKEVMDRWMEQEDSRILSKQLAQMTTSFDDVFDRSKITRIYDDLTSADRFWLRDQLAEAMPGIDTSIRVTCQGKDCRVQYEAQVQIKGNFFLPARAHLPTWFGSYLRYALAIGNGQVMESWRLHLPQEKT